MALRKNGIERKEGAMKMRNTYTVTQRRYVEGELVLNLVRLSADMVEIAEDGTLIAKRYMYNNMTEVVAAFSTGSWESVMCDDASME